MPANKSIKESSTSPKSFMRDVYMSSKSWKYMCKSAAYSSGRFEVVPHLSILSNFPKPDSISNNTTATAHTSHPLGVYDSQSRAKRISGAMNGIVPAMSLHGLAKEAELPKSNSLMEPRSRVTAMFSGLISRCATLWLWIWAIALIICANSLRALWISNRPPASAIAFFKFALPTYSMNIMIWLALWQALRRRTMFGWSKLLRR
mmetsp:Transcript_122758/g.354859  ORF Transcript_122758/g.354859 Transcript_122758/m.354859 type:complete len:204 (-) Transcript_122758:1498-2109(-)